MKAKIAAPGFILMNEMEKDFRGTVRRIAEMGYDGLELFVTGNEERIVVTTRFDNLGKGASGAAIQCMNILIGCDETRGLNV